MRKYFLSIICFIYSFIIFFVKLTGKLGNFLAPQMQNYILISMVVLILLGISLLFTEKHKFVKSDLFLLLPIFMIIASSTGELSLSLANNRTNNIDFKIKENEILQELEEETIEEVNYDFTNVEFDVKDAAYEQLGNYLTYNPNAAKFDGNKIRVRGFVMKNANIPAGYFGFGKYSISCCAADAQFTGFIAKSKENVKTNGWYEIEGILEKSNFENISLVIKVINIKEINMSDEEYYVYPCYAYDDGMCAEVRKYSLQ